MEVILCKAFRLYRAFQAVAGALPRPRSHGFANLVRHEPGNLMEIVAAYRVRPACVSAAPPCSRIPSSTFQVLFSIYYTPAPTLLPAAGATTTWERRDTFRHFSR